MTRRAWLLFLLMAVIWGIPYLFIKVALRDLSPIGVVFARLLLATLVIAPLAARGDHLRRVWRRWRWIVVLAVCEIVAPFLLIALGEQRIPSSLAGLLVAAEPLFIALLALRVAASERVGGARLVGVVVGFIGVVVLLGFNPGRDVMGALMVLAATLLYAVGALVVRLRLADVSSTGITAATLVVSTVMVLPLLPLDLPRAVPDAATLLSLLVLGVVCTAIGLLGFYALIAAAGASRASVITYVNPVVAVGLGIAFLHESIHAATLAGFALVLAGSLVSAAGPPPRLLRRSRTVSTPTGTA